MPGEGSKDPGAVPPQGGDPTSGRGISICLVDQTAVRSPDRGDEGV